MGEPKKYFVVQRPNQPIRIVTHKNWQSLYAKAQVLYATDSFQDAVKYRGKVRRERATKKGRG